MDPFTPHRRRADGASAGLVPTLLVLLLAVPLLAGCLGTSSSPTDAEAPATGPSSETPAEGPGTDSNMDGPPAVEAPAWEVGQLFEYDRSGSWTEGTDGTDRLVVHEATDAGYVTGRTGQAAFAVDLFWSNDPLLGTLGPELDSAIDGPDIDGPPTVLDWPLEDGKTWTTVGYQSEWTFTATRRDVVETPLGTWPGFVIVGRTPGGSTVEATYVPELGTLSAYRVLVSGSDEPVYRYDLVDAGTDHGDTAWTGTRELLFHDSRLTAEDLVPPTLTFEVADDATDIYTIVGLANPGQAASAAVLHGPSGAEEHRQSAGPGESAWALVTRSDPTAGTWRWTLATAGTDECGAQGTDAGCGRIFLRAVALTLREEAP